MENLQIYKKIYAAQDLIDNYPVKLNHKYKKLVYKISCPEGSIHSGDIIVSRWRAISLESMSSKIVNRSEIEMRPGYFRYDCHDLANEIEWHLNFADAYLFYAYGSPLLAQDELQVAEHPALASVREALLAQGMTALTVEDRLPTPVIIRGVERRCSIATNPDPDADRPLGLYGNYFARASREAIEQATTKIDPPSISNIIAIEAPPGETGIYTLDQIAYILTTAVTGFSAAKFESDDRVKVTINTGFWGCGAYGGNRVLMALLQLIAANLAQIDRLVFYVGEDNSDRDFIQATALFTQIFNSNDGEISIAALISTIQSMEFSWGISNGT